MICVFCGDSYELNNQRGGRPKIQKTCHKYSCRSKWWYYKNIEYARERGRKQYWDEKENKYAALRKRNQKAQDKRRFGIDRKSILKRDNYQCQKCGAKKKLHVHHIDGNGRNKIPNNNPENLITWCASCHHSYHSRDMWMKRKKLKI